MPTLQCPQCGGQLDPASTHGGVNRCPYCGSANLMAEGQLRGLTSHALPARHDVEAFRHKLAGQLAENGVDPVPEIEVEQSTVPFLVRRGHVRISPRATRSGNDALAKENEEVHEGYFGVPLRDELPLGVFQAADTSAFTEGPDQFPDDLEGALLRFDDRVREGMVERWQQRMSAKHLLFTNWDDRATWADEVCTLALPVAVLRYRCETRSSWRWDWEDASEDGTYACAVDLHDGSELRWQVPRRHRNLLTLLIAIFVFVFVGVPVLIGLFAILLGLLGAALGRS